MKKFEAYHKYFDKQVIVFTEETAPDWLTSAKTLRGSTMDCRWFWTDCVLTLAVGASVETDFRTIKRIS